MIEARMGEKHMERNMQMYSEQNRTEYMLMQYLCLYWYLWLFSHTWAAIHFYFFNNLLLPSNYHLNSKGTLKLSTWSLIIISCIK